MLVQSTLFTVNLTCTSLSGQACCPWRNKTPVSNRYFSEAGMFATARISVESLSRRSRRTSREKCSGERDIPSLPDPAKSSQKRSKLKLGRISFWMWRPVVGVDRSTYVTRLSIQEVLHPLAHPEALREALTALLFVSRGGKRYRQKRLASRLE